MSSQMFFVKAATEVSKSLVSAWVSEIVFWAKNRSNIGQPRNIGSKTNSERNVVGSIGLIWPHTLVMKNYCRAQFMSNPGETLREDANIFLVKPLQRCFGAIIGWRRTESNCRTKKTGSWRLPFEKSAFFIFTRQKEAASVGQELGLVNSKLDWCHWIAIILDQWISNAISIFLLVSTIGQQKTPKKMWR